MDTFRNDCPRQIAAIREAVELMDAASVERAAHLLKGSIGSFAAPGAFQSAQQLENMGRARDLTAAPDALVQLEEKVQRLIETLLRLQKDLRRECVS